MRTSRSGVGSGTIIIATTATTKTASPSDEVAPLRIIRVAHEARGPTGRGLAPM